MRKPLLFSRWGIDEKTLTRLVDENGSLRGMMLGYVAEHKFRELYMTDPEITDLGKANDHDRKRKGDRNILYKNREIKIEIKSLQTNSVRQLRNDVWTGKSQVDASDRRKVRFQDGTELETTLLLRGEFDILAVNCFAFGEQWRYVFARNDDLPSSPHAAYSAEARKQLLASLVTVAWPPEPPFTSDFKKVLDITASEPDASQSVVTTSKDAPEPKETPVVTVRRRR